MKRTSVLLMGFFFLEGWSAPGIITEGCTVMTMYGEHNGSNPRGSVLLRSFLLKLTHALPEPFECCRTLRTHVIPFQLSISKSPFGVWKLGLVSVTVHDMPGSEATALVDGVKQAGEHTVSWNAADQPGGIYFYRLITASVSDPARASVQIRKMIYVK